jgi:hypothetical protein
VSQGLTLLLPTNQVAFITSADAGVLTPLLFRLTDSTELPILLIGGIPVGSIDMIRQLDADGKLKELVISAGAIPDSSKKPKKGRR